MLTESPRFDVPRSAEAEPVRILTCADGATIAYRRRDGAAPGLVFLAGFMSDMTGTKASFLDDYAASRGLAYLRFDAFGHGASSGDLSAATVGRWRADAAMIIDRLTQGPLILVGSSLGGWIMLLAALDRPERIAGLLGIAAAPDATEALMWRRFPPKTQAEIRRDGAVRMPSRYGEEPYLITRTLIEEGRHHLVMERPLPIRCPVRLIHGMGDPDVPWQTSLALADHIDAKDVELTLVKDGDHRLSRPRDLDLLARTLDRIVAQPSGPA
ncbi:MAG: alpha/beta hydrolase [Stellaceae bacterium]